MHKQAFPIAKPPINTKSQTDSPNDMLGSEKMNLLKYGIY